MTIDLNVTDHKMYRDIIKQTKESIPIEIKELIERREACELKIASIIERISGESNVSVPTNDPELLNCLKEKASYDCEIRELESQQMALDQLK